jgi:type IV secretory pathway TraG/TraD family ATPase VirD4
MNDKLRTDSISPVLNKVGQFLSSQRIRRVVGVRKSTFSLEEVMDEGKILILNLSQGKLGEDTTALLGAMFITKIQLAAMRRVTQPNASRRDFYLYVDEFQNFATGSFTKILSEARKYRLNLIMANQYIGQVEEDVQRAIFGNVGTLATFVVGAGDAAALARELGGAYTEEDLVSLGKYEILLKMAIDGLTSTPFAATTLPLPAVINGNREKITRLALEKYYQKVTPV